MTPAARTERGSSDVKTVVDFGIWVLFFLLISIQDLAGPQAAVGRLAGVPSLFLAPVIVFRSRSRLARLPFVARIAARVSFGWLAAYVIVSLAAVPFLGPDSYGSSPLLRTFKLAVVVALWLLTGVAGAVLWDSGMAFRLRWIVSLVLAGNVLLLLLSAAGREPRFAGNEASFWHLAFNTQQRPRLLTVESSSAGSLLICVACLLLLISVRQRSLRLVAFAALLVAPLTLSRGATSAVPLAVGLAATSWFLLRAGLPRRAWLVGLVLGTLVFTYFGAAAITARSTHSTAGSDATRTAYAEASVRALEDRPLGATFADSVNQGHRWMEQAAADVASRYPASSLVEISDLLSDERASDFSPKTLPGFLIFQAGFIGLFFMLFLAWALAYAASRQRSLLQLFTMFMLLVPAVSFIDTLYAPEFPLVAGVLLAMRDKPSAKS